MFFFTSFMDDPLPWKFHKTIKFPNNKSFHDDHNLEGFHGFSLTSVESFGGGAGFYKFLGTFDFSGILLKFPELWVNFWKFKGISRKSRTSHNNFTISAQSLSRPFKGSSIKYAMQFFTPQQKTVQFPLYATYFKDNPPPSDHDKTWWMTSQLKAPKKSRIPS